MCEILLVCCLVMLDMIYVSAVIVVHQFKVCTQ